MSHQTIRNLHVQLAGITEQLEASSTSSSFQDIPVFNGYHSEDVIDWMSTINEILDEYMIPREMKVKIASGKLRNGAKIGYGRRTLDQEALSYDEFQQELKAMLIRSNTQTRQISDPIHAKI